MSTKSIARIIQGITEEGIQLDVCDVSSQGKILANRIMNAGSSQSKMIFATLLDPELSQKDIEVAIKVFINDGSEISDSIVYEMLVYKYVVDKILSTQQSPNFIGYLGYGECSYKSVMKMIQKKGRIRRVLEDYWENEYDKLSLLMTEKIGQNLKTVSLHTFFIKHEDEEDCIKVLFQLFYSLNVMWDNKLMHNDLHANNILVVIFDEERTLNFKIEDEFFSIKTRFMPFIFDWDRAYSPLVGNNMVLENGYWCEKMDICNDLNPIRDVYTLLCTLSTPHKHMKSLLQFLHNTYYGSRLFINTEDKNTVHKISYKQYKKILKYKASFYNDDIPIFKFSQKQLEKILPEWFGKDKYYENIISSTFYLAKSNDKYYFVIYKEFRCRVTNYDEKYPTPLEMLLFRGKWVQEDTENIFAKYRVSPDDIVEDNGFFFTSKPELLNN